VSVLRSIEIRAYTASDQDNVIDLWQSVFPDAPVHNDPALDIQRKLATQPELFLVALYDENLVGTCMGGFDGHRGWVYFVAVQPEFRRQGIASHLMRELEARLLDLGCPKLNLQIRDFTPEAILFYERLGYSIEKRTSMGKLLSSRTAT
jgi:ribosomal protein S18 acetylase RimI-like enzyme